MAKDNRIQKMRQDFTELRQAIASDIDERFVASEQRLAEKLTHVIVQQLETARQHLEGRLQVHMEDLKSLVTTTAEGYGGTLERIERDLGELKQEMVTKFSDHDKTLANHNRRLVTLERPRRRTRRG